MELTKAQARKLAKGHTIQVKHSQLSGGALPDGFPVHLRKQIAKAMKTKKGMRMQLSPHELQGAGIMDWLKSLVNMVKVGAKPILSIGKPLIKAAAPIIAPAIAAKTGLPISADMVSGTADAVGNLAGVGVKTTRKKTSSRRITPVDVEDSLPVRISSNSNTMLSSSGQHPIFKTQPQVADQSMARVFRGQGFKAPGY